MQVSHFASAPRAGESPHRPGGIGFVNLLTGQEFAQDNFLLTVVDITDDFSTPRHRHNFEQVRIMLEGHMEFGPGQVQEAGSIGYFCEGTYYTQQGKGRSRTLLLQVAGPSGDGYMSRAQMDEGIRRLQSRGKFERGVYTWTDEAGQKHNKDGYEAAWEEIFGRPIRYEKPRYDAPVILWPDRFHWIPAAPGVRTRHLGRFHERGLEIAQVRLDAGASWTPDSAARPLLLVAAGGSGAADDARWEPLSAVRVERGEQATLRAEEEAEFYVLGLPVFS